MNPPGSEFPIDILCLSEPEASVLRALCYEWRSAYDPSSPIERALLEQAVLALFEKRRLLRLRATLQTERARTAELYWLQAIEDDAYKSLLLFNSDCCAATNALERSAVGLRELIRRWERLAKLLSDEGTWYGTDRLEVIRLKGHSPRVLDLYLQEDAYWIWVHCLAAQPNPKQRDIDLILQQDIMPKRLQDKDVQVWRPDPEQSRTYLRDLVTRELTRLKSAEGAFRLTYEEPAKAASRALALAHLTPDEVQLLREIRHQDRSLQQAMAELVKAQKQAAGSGRSRGAGRKVAESALAGAAIVDTPGAPSLPHHRPHGAFAGRQGAPGKRGDRATPARRKSLLRLGVTTRIAPRTVPAPEPPGRVIGAPAGRAQSEATASATPSYGRGQQRSLSRSRLAARLAGGPDTSSVTGPQVSVPSESTAVHHRGTWCT